MPSSSRTSSPAVLADASRAWPAVHVPPEVFLRYAEERLGGSDPESLEGAHVADLYLACACATGDARALALFEERFLSAVPRFVAAIDSSRVFADEVSQQLRTKLFVEDGERSPKILSYTGRGPLGGWLRVAAIRTARNLLRAEKRAAPGQRDDLLRLPSATADPELDYLKEHYGRELRDAFEKTLAALPEKQRNVLRLYYLEAMSSGAIAKLFGVSGAAVRLWIKDCRASILAETSRLLEERLGLAVSDLESIVGLVRSRFDLTLSRVLRVRPR